LGGGNGCGGGGGRNAVIENAGALRSRDADGEPGLYAYWTYQVRIPLDLIWMDQNRLVTEIVPNAQPCKSDSASTCPKFGGNKRSLFVLELNTGMAAKHKLKPGDRIDF
jgi:uncharacterized membrane protein (UPF0127 family)